MRPFVLLLISAGLVAAAFIGFQFWRVDQAVDALRVAHAYLHETVGLSEPVAAVLAGGAFLAVIFATGVLFMRPVLLLAAAAAGLLFALPGAFWLTGQAQENCFHRMTGDALCQRWQTPEGCAIVRTDGARPPALWRFERIATPEDVQACWGQPSAREQEARAPHPAQLNSCSGTEGRLFDGAGMARFYYSLEGERIQLWDRAGAHPISGQPLEVLTPEVGRNYCDQITRDARSKEIDPNQEDPLRATSLQKPREGVAGGRGSTADAIRVEEDAKPQTESVELAQRVRTEEQWESAPSSEPEAARPQVPFGMTPVHTGQARSFDPYAGIVVR